MTEVAKLDDFEKSIRAHYGEPTTSVYTDEEYNALMDSINVPKIGKEYLSTYVGKTDHSFLLSCGFKDVVRVSRTRAESNFFDKLEIGEQVDVLVLGITDTNEYSIVGSVASIYMQGAFDTLSNVKSNEFVPVFIDSMNAAGYNCRIDINGCEVQAFLPQILAGVNKIHEDAKADLVGKTLEMCIESYSYDKGTWIVSRRNYLKQLIPHYIAELNSEDLYDGHVTGTTKFGVFVEFSECLTGMVHKSNLTEEMLVKFENRNISPGEPISFYVKEILNKNKLILTQTHTPSMWDDISAGQKMKGVIRVHKQFGTLVSLDHETSGLVPNNKNTSRVASLPIGSEIDVIITDVDRSKRKIFLDIKG